MCDTCEDNRFELIEKYKQKLLDATNIGDSPEEMAVIDNVLFRFWQMGWLPDVPDTNVGDIVPVVRCRDCKHRFLEDKVWACPFGPPVVLSFSAAMEWTERAVTMDEYYELVLNHRVQSDGRYDPYLEQPIIVKCFVSPLVLYSADINSARGALIDEMCHKIKKYWMLKEENSERHDD